MQARFNFNYSFIIFLMTDYQYKKTAFVRGGVKAQTAGEELQRIQQEHGEITPPLVVDEARPTESPIHEVFEWDDYLAAEQHRQHQARTLIKSIEVIKPEGDTEPVFIHIQSEKAYLPAKTVIQNADLYQSAREAAEKRLREATHSLRQLKMMAEHDTKPNVQTAINLVESAQNQIDGAVI